jgi:hypothetical protein
METIWGADINLIIVASSRRQVGGNSLKIRHVARYWAKLLLRALVHNCILSMSNDVGKYVYIYQKSFTTVICWIGARRMRSKHERIQNCRHDVLVVSPDASGSTLSSVSSRRYYRRRTQVACSEKARRWRHYERFWSHVEGDSPRQR